MKKLNIDKKFCKEALDGLMSYGYKDFTYKFMKEIKLPHKKKTLVQLWLDIDEWLTEGDENNCIKLLEYTDELKMWGKQRVFLFNIDCDNTNLQLSNMMRARRKLEKIYNNPIYEWEIDKPTLVHVKKVKDSSTNDSLLVFKFIEMRKFTLQIENNFQLSEERSTNYFIINLSKGYAELRLQQLPTNAQIKLREEYNLFITEIKRYLEDIFDCFKPISIERVLNEMIRKPIYIISRATFVAGQKYTEATSTFLVIINHLFSNPRASSVTAYWKCKQRTIGRSRLFFTLYANSNSIAIGSLADSKKINYLLQRIINIHNGVNIPTRIFLPGLIHRPYIKLHGQPKAQAFILSAGAIAALLIWIIMDGIGNYFLEEWLQKFLGGIPLVVLTIFIEIFWILIYYGWNRTIRSFIALKHLNLIQLWKLISDAKKNKNKIKKPINLPILSHYKTN